VRTDVAATPDGLPPELSGRRFAGDGVYVREVVPVCAVDGRTEVGIAFVEPFLLQQHGDDHTGRLGFRRCVDGDAATVTYRVLLAGAGAGDPGAGGAATETTVGG
jgi:hypothetical protein